MSNIDQAFVKAFARRQTAEVNQAENPVEVPTLKRSSDRSIRVNRSVAEQTSLWIDASEDRIVHAERAHQETVPPPHSRSIGEPPVAAPVDESSVNEVSEPRNRITSPPDQSAESTPTDETPSVAAESIATEVEPESAPAEFSFESTYAIASFTTDLYASAGQIERNLVRELETTESASQPVEPLTKPEAPEDEHAESLDVQPLLKIPSDVHAIDDEASDQAPVQSSVIEPEATVESEPTVEPETIAETLSDAPAPEPTPEPVDTPEFSFSADSSTSSLNRSAFRPSWEIDCLDIPETVERLFFEDAILETVGRHLAQAVDSGLRSALVTSVQSGEGRSTVATGIALAASASGLKVALVDADLRHPTLADDLRLDLDLGWLEAGQNGIAADEVAVFSGEEQITFLPLFVDESDEDATEHLESIVAELKQHFDLVILDGASAGYGVGQETEAIDSAFIVRDMRSTSVDDLNELARRLMRSGIRGVGVIENFVEG
ncbi:tyrosine-protein kinase family protein [Crateriforma conspicua]|uniref:Tyrosine-protein kinase YwqD n=1 Tax=Crateriforma conspicua TaxID=2527996 RepID=A0A5C5Y761_9PLAN|nr:division plane positioning ATPase MipZ [Crateriforma conspicua]QDV65397.1 Tyrosine-protein kinase YwqD [Crateriforma conspicua]TWT70789.1 Tyrosine-protein kinase YwqD [Crateriforma conspicua]